MAFQTDNTLISNREMMIELVLTPFRAIGRWFISLAENNSRTQALRQINNMTDADLAARGLTRAEAVNMMFRHDA
ncbi:DUF1127 domain-containing protein [Yoonia sp. SDW83-1]|uniref:DUF1127 domain-containing protein n=1 Tax=Yoonia sp. SDW83-1 TaxID=3366945 RepID=UPI00398C37ED